MQRRVRRWRGRLEDAWPARIDAVPPGAVAVVILAAALRLYRLGAESLWVDETSSVLNAQTNSLWYLLVEYPTADPHPPLHYVLLKLWMAAFGRSEVSVRLQAALFGVAAVAGTYYLGRALFGRRAGTVAALLGAASPFWIWYSQEVRMYSLLLVLTVASYYALVGLCRAFTLRRAGAYVAVTVLLGYTHVYALFVILAQALYLATRPALPGEGELALSARRWVPLHAAVGALLAPWLVVLVARALGLSAGESSPVSWIPEPEPSIFGDVLFAVVAGANLDPGLDGAIPGALPPLLGLLAGGCVLLSAVTVTASGSAGGRAAGTGAAEDGETDGGSPAGGRSLPGPFAVATSDLPAVWLLLLLAVVPVVVPYVVSTVVAPVMVLRYTLPASVGGYLLVARGARVLRPVPVRYLVVGVLVVGLLVPLPVYYAEDQKQQWREAFEFVDSRADGDDVVVLAPGWSWESAAYYYDGDATVERVSTGASLVEVRGRIRGHDDVFLVFAFPSDDTTETFRDAVEGTDVAPIPTTREYIAVEVYHYRSND